MSEQLNFVELCSGCGGLSKGFIDTDFTPIFLNDIDKWACKTLRRNHPGVEVKECDLNDFINKPLHSDDIHVLIAGLSCQSFSMSGKREGLDDPRGGLMYSFVKLINFNTPKVFVIENVKGLLYHDKGKTLKTIISLLESSGNYIVKYKVLNANDFGVPQKRHRIFIIGIRSDLDANLFEFPEPQDYKPVLRDVLMDCPESDGTKYSQSKFDVLKLVPPGGCWVDLPEDIQREYMGKSFDSGGGKRGIARRMSMDEACLTLLCSPSQLQTERCHPTETRPFTIREYARIQTFPDDYEFIGSISNRYKQIGNAVPVKLAIAIAKCIRDFLEKTNKLI